MRHDVIGVVEACYSRTPDPATWAKEVLGALKSFERGFGGNFMTFRIDGGSFRVERFDTTSPAEQDVPELIRMLESMPRPVFEFVYQPGVTTASRRFKQAPQSFVREFGAWLRKTSTVDAVAVIARDHDGRGTHVSFPVPPGSLPLPPRALGQLSRIAAHLVSARRLREAVGPAGPDSDAVDAVLAPSGRVLDARGDAKEKANRARVSEATQRIERARSRLRRTDPDEALELWRALVGGAWSLVDHCESDGKRLILARRNAPGVKDPKALAPTERDVLAYAALGHSNKFIGYMLGISPSTVAEHLLRSQRKLSVGSRREMIQMFAGSSATASRPVSRT